MYKNNAELKREEFSPRIAEHLLQEFLKAKFKFEHFTQFQSPWTLRFKPLGYVVSDMLLTLFELYALYSYGGKGMKMCEFKQKYSGILEDFA